MSSKTWAAKRFWGDVFVVPLERGFGVKLDQRRVKTPAKADLIVPTEGMAQSIAAEWQAQVGVIKPQTMPFTRMANSAIDKVTMQFDDVADFVAAYGASDLLCYRATHPEELTDRQSTAWDPLLNWANQELKAPLSITTGVMPIEQDPVSVSTLRALVHELGPFELAALHDLVAISGSLILGLAVVRSRITSEQAWCLSRIDECWQIEQWGPDDESVAAEAMRRSDLLFAGGFFELI